MNTAVTDTKISFKRKINHDQHTTVLKKKCTFVEDL